MTDQTTFHLGEQSVQKRLGVHEEIGPWASKVVRPWLPEQHRDFYAALPFLVAAARDDQGRPWATLLTGEPGFAHSPDPGRLVIDATPPAGDALEGQLVAGRELGLLGIELASRRRNRVNGTLAPGDGLALDLAVGQSFGNCPQYIRERSWSSVPLPAEPPKPVRSRVLTPALRARIEAADTFFIASGHRGEGDSPAYGMDASHRGGAPGFVRVLDERRLVFPDYAGNNHFNTIGNLVVDGRVGLLFVDFERGGLLQLTGRATIDWDSPAVAEHPGARRLVEIELDEAIELVEALPLRWRADEEAVRRLELVARRRESDDVLSFVFASPDGESLPDFEPGQHLPIELEIPGQPEPVRRTYSLSNAPGEGVYRISVKRESKGLASRFLHDELAGGARVKTRAPAGEFVLEAGTRPVVLLSAGVGVTPMLSMLRTMTRERDPRRVLFLHGARDGRHHALDREIRELVELNPQAELRVAYSRPLPDDRAGRDYDAEGRLDGARLAEWLPDPDADFYLCGPAKFMAEVQQSLEARGVASERIHSEAFGPVG